MTLFPKCQHYFSDDSNVLRVVSTYSTTGIFCIVVAHVEGIEPPSSQVKRAPLSYSTTELNDTINAGYSQEALRICSRLDFKGTAKWSYVPVAPIRLHLLAVHPKIGSLLRTALGYL